MALVHTNAQHNSLRRAMDALEFALAAHGIAVSECKGKDRTMVLDYHFGFGVKAEPMGTAMVQVGTTYPVHFAWATAHTDLEELVVAHAKTYSLWAK